MSKKLDPNTYRQCKSKVDTGDSICCSCYSAWHHRKCCGLSKTEFKVTLKIRTYTGLALIVEYIGAENVPKWLVKNKNAFFMIAEISGFIKKCSLLETNGFEILSNSNEPWFCWDCLKNTISCISLDSTKIQRLFGTLPKQTNISESSGIPVCLICNRKNSQPKSRIECVQCKFVFHKKCQKHSNVNTFVCNFCNKEMFPFADIDLRDLIDLF